MSEADRDLRPIVYVVDDDESVRGALANLLDAVNLDVEIFASAEDFLSRELTDRPCCVILDVRLPGVSGLTIQGELAGTDAQVPIIFLTGHADTRTVVQTLKAGADDFLTKPVNSDDLFRAIERAFAHHQTSREQRSKLDVVNAHIGKLTPRERQVFELIVRGKTNKQIGVILGATERTIKAHRHRVMEKMQVRTLAELVSLAERVGVLGGAADSRQMV